MKRVAFFIVLILSLLAINSLLHSIIDLWQKKDLVVSAERQLQKEKKDNEILKKEVSRVQSPKFLEEEARNKLVLGRTGEQLILLPSPTTAPTPTQTQTTDSNITQWMKLFF